MSFGKTQKCNRIGTLLRQISHFDTLIKMSDNEQNNPINADLAQRAMVKILFVFHVAEHVGMLSLPDSSFYPGEFTQVKVALCLGSDHRD